MVTASAPVAPASAASVATRAALPADEAVVLAALRDVVDPEIPSISIVDLGMVGAIEVDVDRIRVELLPTFIGCHALGLIQAAVAERLATFGRQVDVSPSMKTTWTSDRISSAGHASLRRAGIAPPSAVEDVRCPYCASDRVAMDNAFGPAQCRSLFYCRGCRQPFEAFKPV